LSLTNGSLTAEFQSSSGLVRDLLKSNMEKLKNVLEGQGVAVDKLAVESPKTRPRRSRPNRRPTIRRTMTDAAPVSTTTASRQEAIDGNLFRSGAMRRSVSPRNRRWT